MATSGLIRGGFADRISHRLAWYHAVSQGALGVECRTDDVFVTREILASLVHPKSMLECTAERVLMKCLEGGCSVPIGVRTCWLGTDTLKLEAIVLSLDGTQRVEASETQQLDEPNSAGQGQDLSLAHFTDVSADHHDEKLKVRLQNCVQLGRRLAQTMISMGVRDILAAINRDTH